MKADKSKMFSVSLSRLRADQPAPFPLFLFLELNDRMVPVRLGGDAIGQKKFDELRRAHRELWVPIQHEKEFSAYLDYLEKTGSIPTEPLSPSDPKAEAESEKMAGETRALLATGEESGLIALAKELLKEFQAIEAPAAELCAESSRRCKAFADEFLARAALNEGLFSSVQALRSIQDPDEHSVFVGSLAAVMAVACGKTDAHWVANLVAAATFHDIGLAALPIEILAKNNSGLNPEERKIYEGHVVKGVILLKDSEDPFPKEVIRMVQEHHEKADGSGFPSGKKDLFEGSRFLISANLVDGLRRGKQTGETVAPHSALQVLDAESPAGPEFRTLLKSALSA